MEQSTFGSLSVPVSKLGLGCSSLSPFSGSLRFASAREVVNRCLDRGVTFFDTADSYGAGWSERWLGRALGAKRDQVLIATKCGRPATLAAKTRARLQRVDRGRLLPSADPGRLLSGAYIQSALEQSLRRLRTDYVDVLLLHSPPAEALMDGSWAEALSSLRDRGLVRYYGISAVSPEDASTAIRDFGVDCVEFEINPCTASRAASTLALAGKHGAAVIARQVFGSGSLLDGIVTRIGSLTSSEYRPEVAAALLQFVLEMPNVSVALVGMSSPEHVDANTTAAMPSAEFVSQVLEAAGRICDGASERANT